MVDKKRLAIFLIIDSIVVISVVAALAIAFMPHGPANEYITYDGNGGFTDSGETSYTKFTVVCLDSQFSRYGYIFTNWNTEADGSGVTYNVGDIVPNMTMLYAQWTKEQKVTVHTENTSERPAPTYLTYNEQPVSEGSTFGNATGEFTFGVSIYTSQYTGYKFSMNGNDMVLSNDSGDAFKISFTGDSETETKSMNVNCTETEGTVTIKGYTTLVMTIESMDL